MTLPPQPASADARPQNKPALGALAAAVGITCAAILSPFVSGRSAAGRDELQEQIAALDQAGHNSKGDV